MFSIQRRKWLDLVMCVIFQGLEDLSGGLLHRQEADISGFSDCKIGDSTKLERRPFKPYLRLLSSY